MKPELDKIQDSIRLQGVASEMIAEVWRARELHGKQADMAFGTGPDADLINDDGTEDGLRYFEAIYQAESNAEFADLARRRCKALSAEGKPTWESVLTEEFAEAMAEDDPAKLRAELVQVMAMAASWITIIDERA